MDPVLEFFTAIDDQGGIVVRETPKFDLDLYLLNYRGRTRFDRLLHIGRASVPLCVDALKGAVAEAKRGHDTHRYRQAWECIRVAAPAEPEAVFDQEWVDQMEKYNKAELARLQAELKGYKNNLIKESVRMGNEDLGKHLESMGNLDLAAETYTKMRPDVSTPKHIVDVHKHLVSVAVQRREWASVMSHVAKMQGHQSVEDDKALLPYVKVAQGVALLGQEKYFDAAMCFLETPSSVIPGSWNNIASANDVAVYGGLLALASMDRKDLQATVLDNSSFRAFLELEPHIRRAVNQFVSGRYSQCISTLEAYRADYLLDMYLFPHVPKLYSKIRSKCIVQYLIPFSCVTLDSMTQNFGRPGMLIEDELAAMIEAGALDARINTIDKLVTRSTRSARFRAQKAALETVRLHEQESLHRLRAMSLVAADLEVKGLRKFAAAFTESPDRSFDDGVVP